MGWADFGQALFQNASTAAGTLAEVKLALRQEERADRQLALQEQSHKATVEYQKAKMAFDEWATTQEHAFREEDLQYKTEMLEWQKGEQTRKETKIKEERDGKIKTLETLKEASPEMAHIFDAAIAEIETGASDLTEHYVSQHLLDLIDKSDAPDDEKELQRNVARGVPGAEDKLKAYYKAQGDDKTGEDKTFGLIDSTFKDPAERQRIKEQYLKNKAGISESDVAELNKNLQDADQIEDEELRETVKKALIEDFTAKKVKKEGDDSPSEVIADEDLWYQEGRLPPDTVKDIIAFRKEITSSQNYRDLVKSKRALKVMAGSLKGDSPVAEVGVLYTFIRAIDPGSVVREGELAIFTAARGAMARVEELAGKAAEGTALTDDEKKEIAKIAKIMRDAYAEDYENIKAGVVAGLKAYGAYMRKDKDGNVIEITDPDTFMQLASFEDVNIEVPEDELKSTNRTLNMPNLVGDLKKEGKSFEESVAFIRKHYPDEVEAFIEEWLGETANADD